MRLHRPEGRRDLDREGDKGLLPREHGAPQMPEVYRFRRGLPDERRRQNPQIQDARERRRKIRPPESRVGEDGVKAERQGGARRLHPREQKERDALRRRHVEPASEDSPAQSRGSRRLHQKVRRAHAGLVRVSPDDARSDSRREKAEEVAARVENRAHREGKPVLERLGSVI